MLEAHWPLFALRVVTPRLEIRLPRDEDLVSLLEVVAEGIYDPATMPFLNPWTDAPPAERARSALQWWWGARARWTPEDWNYTGAVFVDGRPVGVQDLMAQQFPKLGVVKTGSWLGQRYQGQGLGKEMRAAVLHLGFEGLGAREAESGAWADNAASIAVSRAFG
ncbi:MAG: GNAT family N-acetyltransferase [Acidimicrobiales bacterium]